jgi:RNase adapter protein RapZ
MTDPSGPSVAGPTTATPPGGAGMDPGSTDLVILTGMSGAGRSTAANVLEDLGWYVVDNIPPQLILSMAELAEHSRGGVNKLAAVIDVRSRSFFTAFRAALQALRDKGWAPRVIFVDATDEALVRRFESVRRPHPLQGQGRMLDGIIRERTLLGDLRSEADVVIDTSGLNVHQLSAKVSQIFAAEGGPRLRVAVMSFGFKYGIPLDADLVFDLRFLPNPFWVPELRGKTGRSEDVSDYVLGQQGAREFADNYVELLTGVTGGYLTEGKRFMSVAIGCTGGKHRSVAMTEEIAGRLRELGHSVGVVHRDLGRE